MALIAIKRVKKMKKTILLGIILLIISILAVKVLEHYPTSTRNAQAKLRNEKITSKQNVLTQDVAVTNKQVAGLKKDTLEEILRGAYNDIKELNLKGKTLDRYDNPIQDVNVKICWDKAGWLVGASEQSSVTWVKSDHKGEWSLVLNKTLRAYVEGASKEGYEYIYSVDSGKNLAEPYNKKEAGQFIVRLRKKAEESLLVINPESGYGRTYVLEVAAKHSATGQIDVLDDKTQKRDCYYWDVFVHAKYEEALNSWQTLFFVTNQTDGIVVSDELLYEAPPDGYKKEVVWLESSKPRYLYLKTRAPSIYSRINLEYYQYTERPNNRLRITYKSFTNPYGERSLEDAGELRKYTFAAEELIHEAKQAIQTGTLPKKPENLEAYLEEREKAIRKAKNIPMR